ncbi:MAG TPA: hypothetical protein VKM94_11435 [Blastocatellia bacterium]|nr:hypothetical protein [Blastocatellia bacterium]
MRLKQSTSVLLLVVFFALTSSATVKADDRNRNDSPVFTLYATDGRSPIGIASTNSISSSAIVLDGRPSSGDQLIWGGELIQAPINVGARVMLPSIGIVSVSPGAVLRMSANGDATNKDSLSVSLLAGNVTLRLGPTARAEVQASTVLYVSSAGASFRVATTNGEPLLNTFNGEVRAVRQTPPADVNIKVVDDLGRPVAAGSQLSIRARSTRQVQVQVTDKNDKPLPDLPVLFSLGSPCLGSFGLAGAAAVTTLQKKTDKKGLAAVVLTAGAARCAGSILAKVEGTNASVEIKADVYEKQGFWTTRNTLLVSAAAAGAGVGIGLAISNSGGEPIRQVPPPGVKP